jgi:hypothetical protein
MKDRVSLPTHAPIYEKVAQWAIDHIDDPFPTIVANDYGSWSNGITSMRRFIETMVFMYWMTDDVAYAEAGIRWLMTIPTLSSDSMYPGFWQIPCGMAMVLASGYDGFHALLTPVELQTLRMEMIGRCAEQMGPLNADYYPNFLAQMTAYGVCGLALGDDYMGSAEWVSYGVQQANFIFDRLVDGWAEGGMYATYALDVLIPFLDALKRKAGIDILAERGEILNQMADYYIYMNYNGGPLPMEDSVDKDHWDRNYAVGLSVMYWLANRYGNGYALYFADALVDQSRWAAFAWKPTIPPLDIATLPTTRYFPGIGYVIARSAWGPLAAGDNSLIVIFKSGHSAWHAHPNQNSFNVFMNGSWVTAGPGYITNDDRYDRSRTMNVILGDDREQAQEIGDYENAPYDTRGIVEEVEVAPYYVYARGDATPVYTAIDPSVGDLQWKRHIAIIDGSYFVIMDDVKAPAPEKLEFLFQGNRGSFSLADNLVRLSHGIQLDCVVVEPSPYVTQLITDTNITRFPQMRIRSPAPVAAQNFLTVFFPNIPVLPVTEYKQGNLLGVSVRTDADHIDLILFSADGNPVSELIELGDYYVADDGGSYTFDGTRVAVNFNQYMVMNLVKTGPAIQNHAIIAIQFYDKYGILLI